MNARPNLNPVDTTTELRQPFSNAETTAPAFDTLEPRRLMSGSAAGVNFDDHVLTLRGEADHANRLHVELDDTGRNIRGVVNGTPGEWVDNASVRSISVVGGDDVDTLWVDTRLGRSLERLDVHRNVEHVRLLAPETHNVFLANWHRMDGLRTVEQLRRDISTAEVAVATPAEREHVLARPVPAPAEVTIAKKAPADAVADAVPQPLSPALPKVTGLSVIDANSNQVVPGLESLRDGAVLSTSDLTREGGDFGVSFRAEVDGSTVGMDGSVLFEIDGPGDFKVRRVENVAPWASFGNNGDDYFGKQLKPGTYTIRVTPFTERHLGGTEGVVQTFRLRVVEMTKPEKPADDTGNVTRPTPRPDLSNHRDAPKVRVETLAGNLRQGQSLHLSGRDTVLFDGRYDLAHFEWNFGNPDGRFNVVRGYNAAHVYEQAGTYTVSLTVTDSAGRTQQQVMKVTVRQQQWTALYVDAVHGNDTNDGSRTGQAVRTIARAHELLSVQTADEARHTEVLFRRGQTFGTDATFHIDGRDVTLGAWGEGLHPVIRWDGNVSSSPVVVGPDARRITIRDLAFDTSLTGTEKNQIPSAIRVAGTAVTVMDNVFIHVNDAVNANGFPDGLLLLGNKDTSDTSIVSYFLWGQGTNLTVLGNEISNSTREHVIRLSRADSVTISGNTLSNIDRRDVGDRFDTAKGVITMQRGSFGYVTDNTLRGPAGSGPLGRVDGLADKDARFNYAVWEGNHIDDTLRVSHGASFVTMRYNLVEAHDAMAFEIEGYDVNFGRGVSDVTIHGNVVINHASQGQFMVSWAGSRRVQVTENVYHAPQLEVGVHGSAAMSVRSRDLSSFSRIDGNLWPTGTNGIGWALGGIHYVGAGNGNDGFLTAEQWNALPQVGADEFADGATPKLAVLNRFGVPTEYRQAA